MSILIATDFSPCSRAALRLAAAFARSRSSPLIVVHAIEAPAIAVDLVPIGLSAFERERLVTAEADLAWDTREIRKQGIDVQTRVAMGHPATVIEQMVIAERPELLVIGTHGRKGLERLLLGSVAASVVRHVACPVLVTGGAEGDLAHWAGQAPLRIAVGIDGSFADQAAFAWVRVQRDARSCEPTVVYLFSTAEAIFRYGAGAQAGESADGRPLATLMEADARREVETALGGVPNLQLRGVAHDAAQELADEAAFLDADALVIGVPRSSRHGFIEPAAVLRAASVPVLCVPELALPADTHPGVAAAADQSSRERGRA